MAQTEDIFSFAMQMEVDGKNTYHSLAAASKHEGVKSIFLSLAEDEVKHYNYFKMMKEGTKPDYAKTTSNTASLNVFQKIVADRELYDKEDMKADVDSIQAYKQAAQVEQDSYELYEKKAAEQSDPFKKAVLLKIAAEERLHQKLLTEVIKFLERPLDWIDCAEFSHIGEDPYGAGASQESLSLPFVVSEG